MALDLLLQCHPVLKAILEQTQAVGVCPVSREFEQAHDECCSETNPRIQIAGKQNVEEDVKNISEGSVGETIKATESSTYDEVTHKGMVYNSKSHTVGPTEVEITLKERVGNSGCDKRVGCSKEMQHDSDSSNLPQNELETEVDLAEQEEENSLVRLVEQRLQFVLRSLTKLCLSKTGNTKKEKE
jgi:hypothetical protein